ncbi:MAG: DUF3413 domain-containing protein [Lonepinella koalarum]|nr:DUF3413 domain-containing protein [Lonepinella koalarum]
MLDFRSKQYREQTSQKISWGHWFAFFNIIWSVLIGSRYAFIIDWPDTLWGKLYFFISLFGHFSFICFAVYLLVIFPLSFLIKNERTFRGISVIIATLATTLLFLDTEVFARFNLHLSSLVWNLLVNPENGELSRHWQIFFSPMPFLLLLQMLFSRWAWYRLRSLERQKWIRYVGFTLTAFFVATHLIYAWADAYVYRPITMQKSNFPLAYPMTARTFLEKNGLLDKTVYSGKLAEEGRPEALKMHYPKRSLQFGEITEKPNLLFLNISGLRADAINQEDMPNLVAFAEKSTQFMNHYSSGNNHNTGLVGMFYGINAGYLDSILQNKTESVLLEKLKQEGYQFHFLSSAPFKEVFSQQLLFKGKRGISQLFDNKSAVENLLDLLGQPQESPFFSYVNLDVIGPMDVAKSADLTQEKQAYKVQLQKLDEQLVPILAKFPRENLFVVITADQGYTFQQKEKDEHNFSVEQIQVPFILSWKNSAAAKYEGLSSHSDLVPTLLNGLFNVQNPMTDYAEGQNLLQFKERNWVLLANYRWNVIITPEGTQHHIDKKGNYQKFDRTYQKQPSTRPPLGLFLEVFNQQGAFFDK